MPRSRRTGRILTLAVVFLAAVSLSACLGGDDTGPEEDPRLTRIRVSPDSAQLTAIGATEQYSATGLDQFGDPFPGVDFEWSSSEPSVVTVDSTGLATARDSGRALVQATAQGIGDAGVATVVIQRDDPASIEPVSGGGQHGTTLHAYGDSLVVRALKENGEPATGVIVDFRVASGTGSVSPTEAATGVNGTAATALMAGPTTGPVTVEARADTVGPATFQVTTTVLYVEIIDDFFVDPHGRLNTEASGRIQVGRDTVLFEYSAGTTRHTVTSGSGPGGSEGDGIPPAAADTMDSGLLDPGDSYRFVPDAEGTWTFFCEEHPNEMYGAEIVAETP